MKRPNRTMYSLLGFLTWRPMSGYDIKKAIENSTSNFWSESYGQIYPILAQLTRQGLATKAASDQRGKRDRYVFTITEKGQKELRRWLGEPTEPPLPRNELLLKLFFGRQTDRATNQRQLEAYRMQQVRRLEKYRVIRARLESQFADHPDLPYWLITLRYGECERRTLLSWCDETLALLKRISNRRTRRPKRSQTAARTPRRARLKYPDRTELAATE